MLITARTMGASSEAVVISSHERFVDLQRVDGETSQITQAGPSGSEVIDGELHPQRLELVERGVGHLEMGHQDAFGELDFKIAGLQPRLGQDVDDALQEGVAPKFERGNIDRYRNGREPGVLPRSRLTTGFVDDPAADRRNQPALFGDGHELTGASKPRSGWRQRMSASAPATAPVCRSTFG